MATSQAASVAPKTLDELRQRLQAARRPKSDLRLGRGSTNVLAAMVDAPSYAAVSSISEIAQANSVNPSTVTRLAKKLGYHGFADLQDIFRRYVADKGGFYSGHAASLLPETGETESGSVVLLREIAESEIANVAGSLEDIRGEQLDEASRLLAGARRVRVLGLRQCFSLAHFFAYALHLVRDGVAALGSSGHTLTEELADLGGQDAVVVISFRPYTSDTVEACAVVRRQGTPIIALTDSHGAPIAGERDLTFVVETEGAFYFNGLASSLIVIEALLALVARALGKKAVRRLENMERLFEALHVEKWPGEFRTYTDRRNTQWR